MSSLHPQDPKLRKLEKKVGGTRTHHAQLGRRANHVIFSLILQSLMTAAILSTYFILYLGTCEVI